MTTLPYYLTNYDQIYYATAVRDQLYGMFDIFKYIGIGHLPNITNNTYIFTLANCESLQTVNLLNITLHI